MKKNYKILGKVLLGFSSLIIIMGFTSLALVADEQIPKSILDQR